MKPVGPWSPKAQSEALLARERADEARERGQQTGAVPAGEEVVRSKPPCEGTPKAVNLGGSQRIVRFLRLVAFDI